MLDTKPFKVKATMQGFYNNKLQYEGVVFYIRKPQDFSDMWMKSLDTRLDTELKKLGVEADPAPKRVPQPVAKSLDEIDEEPSDDLAGGVPPEEFIEPSDKSNDVI